MTNEELVQQGHQIVWHGGMKDVMLCPDPWAERLYATDGDIPGSSCAAGGVERGEIRDAAASL